MSGMGYVRRRCSLLQQLDKRVRWVAMDALPEWMALAYQSEPLTACAPPHVTVACMACTVSQLRPKAGDTGLPPPTLQSDAAPASREELLQRCLRGTTLAASFRGRKTRAPIRMKLGALNNKVVPGLGAVEVVFTDHAGLSSAQKARGVHDEVYEAQLRRSHFGLAPRGDSLFSYRFSELAAAGVIPIVLSDGWAFPFSQLIDWSELALVVPEANPAAALAMLSNMTLHDVCKRRVRLYDTYHEWLKGPEQWLAALARLLENRRKDFEVKRDVADDPHHSLIGND
jgi:hypothetical protein